MASKFRFVRTSSIDKNNPGYRRDSDSGMSSIADVDPMLVIGSLYKEVCCYFIIL